MKKTLLATILAANIAIASAAQTSADSIAADTTFIFTDEICLPTTSVKDQAKSGTCWCFAGTSHLENEILRISGDSLDISEMYTVRRCYEEKADRFIRLYGETNFSPGGSIMDVPHVWRCYGAIPEEAYPGLNYGEDKHTHGELDAAVKAYLNAVVSRPNKKLSTAWRRGLEGILDAYFGPVPETFEYNGKTYTPQSYAASLPVNIDEYIPLTSFTHHPFYTTFPVEVPDNWLWAQYYNLPLDEMQRTVDYALEHGYTVVWAADVSEGGFKWTDGVALMPLGKDEADMDGTELARWVTLSTKERANEKFNFKAPVEEITVTQDSRQEMFDSQETTDDHGMVIVGTATDQKGNRYYKVKNSWDTNQKYNGYFYVSMPYFQAKTVDILVHREGIPKDIRKKLGIK